MKRSVVYPEWAEKYREKGRTLRKVRDGYGLYQCTSQYVKGQKYPKSVQTYLGMITEKDGFIPKRSLTAPKVFLEYGLSHFIMANFKRDLERSTFGASPELLRLGIIYYLFGSINDTFIRSTYISHGMEEELIQRYEKGVSSRRLTTLSNKIESSLLTAVPNTSHRLILTKLLFLSVIGSDSPPESVLYSKEVIDIVERYGLRL